LKKVARFEAYRGFLFGSLNPDVKPLAEHLGEATKMIDLMVDQAPDGLEVLRGSSSYIYDGNWKLQAENGADGYHVSSVHWNYIATTSRRKAESDDIKAMDISKMAKQKGGYYSFENGHLMVWSKFADPTSRPVYAQFDKLTATYGRAKAQWMVGNLRTLCLYPNVYLMDQMSSQLRVFRPLAVDKTAFANTRISSMPVAWRRPTIWRNSALVSRHTWPRRCAGTTCRAARRTGSRGPMRRRRRSTFVR